MRTHTLGFVLLAGAALAACAGSVPVMQLPGDSIPSTPFRLEILVIQPVARNGVVGVEYRLTNSTQVGVSGCASSWEDLEVLQRGGIFQSLSSSLDGINRGNYFRVPPLSTLVWRREIELPSAVTTGPAEIRGLINCICNGLWIGVVRSTAVAIEVQR